MRAEVWQRAKDLWHAYCQTGSRVLTSSQYASSSGMRHTFSPARREACVRAVAISSCDVQKPATYTQAAAM